MNRTLTHARAAFERSLPGLRKFGKGALCATPLFFIGTVALGFFASFFGVPVPQVDTTDLVNALPWTGGGD